MNWIHDWWGLLVVIGGWLVSVLAYLFSHGKKHREIDLRLSSSDEDNEEMKSDLRETKTKTQEIAVDVAHIRGVMDGINRHINGGA